MEPKSVEDDDQCEALRFDGVYIAVTGLRNASCLRFFDDGIVLAASVLADGTIEDDWVPEWLTNASEIKPWHHQGKYRLKGRQIRFSIEVPGGITSYDCQLSGRTILARSTSTATNRSGRSTHMFRPFKTATQQQGAADDPSRRRRQVPLSPDVRGSRTESMSFWKRLLHPTPTPVPKGLVSIRLTMEGWSAGEESRDGRQVWRDALGNVVSVAEWDEFPGGLPDLTDESDVRQWCRSVAEGLDAGLIEAHVLEGPLGPWLAFIYKQLRMPAYVYTGMALAQSHAGVQVWTIFAGEHGTTGVRDAVVTSELMNSGQMTIEQFKESWAQDPYDSGYSGVDRKVLRFVSDVDGYDEQFPNHPLSVVRRAIILLPYSVEFELEGE